MAIVNKDTRKFAELYGGQVVGPYGQVILKVNVDDLTTHAAKRIMKTVVDALNAEYDTK